MSPGSGTTPTGPPVTGASFMSIGEVLSQLRPDFSDVTISKIRFLEDEGLIKPERSSSGYRRFSRDDVARLRYVLTAQRDRYLPLKVIKDQLDAVDQGLTTSTDDPGAPLHPVTLAAEAPAAEAPAAEAPASEAPAAEAPAAEALAPRAEQSRTAAGPEAQAFAPDLSELRLSRAELQRAAGLSAEQLDQVEQYGLLRPRSGGSHYDGDSLMVARTVAEMSQFGIEPRHLRPFKAAADREIGLVEQVVTPLVSQRSPEARARAQHVARELAALSVRLHTTLVKIGLQPGRR